MNGNETATTDIQCDH